MTIDSADDSKISNRTITTNRITKLRRSLPQTLPTHTRGFLGRSKHSCREIRGPRGQLAEILNQDVVENWENVRSKSDVEKLQSAS